MDETGRDRYRGLEIGFGERERVAMRDGEGGGRRNALSQRELDDDHGHNARTHCYVSELSSWGLSPGPGRGSSYAG